MDKTKIFTDKQLEIIKQHIEDNFYETGPGLNIDYEQVWNDIVNTPGFAPEDKEERAKFLQSEAIQSFTEEFYTAGRHQQLATYEGFQDFFKESIGLDIKSRGITPEQQAMMDMANNDYSNHPDNQDAGNTPEAKKDKEKNGPEKPISADDRNKMAGEMAKEVEKKKREQQQKQAAQQDIPKKAPSAPQYYERPSDFQNVMGNLTGTMGPLGAGAVALGSSILTAPIKLTEKAFQVGSTSFNLGRQNKMDRKSEQTGNFFSQDSAARVINRRLASLSKDQEKFDKAIEVMKEDPTSIEKRSDVVAGARRLADRLSHTAELADKAGVKYPDLKGKFNDTLKKKGDELKSSFDKQSVLKLDNYESLKKAMKNMLSKISDLFKIKKPAAEATSDAPAP